MNPGTLFSEKFRYSDLEAPRPPRRQDRQTPNPLPVIWMKPQSVVMRVSSAALS